jgi:hypothetical protein
MFKFLFLQLSLIFSISVFIAGILLPTAIAATAPPLGTALSFSVVGSSTVSNTGPSVVFGNLGVSPGTAVIGFPPGKVSGGSIHAADAVASQARSDVTAAYINLAGQSCDFVLTGQDLGGKTLVSGTYCFTSSAQLTGQLTLDAKGNPFAVFIFQIGTTLTTASNSSVIIINGGSPCNVYWQVGSSATLGTTTDFIGNILALSSVTLQTGANIKGRALARNAAVTLDRNNISNSHCESDTSNSDKNKFRFQCEFAGEEKSGTNCTAAGQFCDEQATDNLCDLDTNFISLSCDDGFRLSDNSPFQSLISKTLLIKGALNGEEASISVSNFDKKPGRYSSNLILTTQDELRGNLAGSCNFRKIYR